MDYVRTGGLALGAISKMTGGGFIAELSMIVEELYKGSNQFIGKISNVEEIVKGQVLAHYDAGKTALNNSTFNSLTEQQQYDEVLRASYLFELCYAELRNIPFMGSYKAEVAFAISMCHCFLRREDLMRHWLKASADDFAELISAKDPEGASEGDKGLQEVAIKVFSRGIVATVVLGGLTFVSAGAALPWFLGSATITATALKTAENKAFDNAAKNHKICLFRQQKAEARKALPEVQQIIKDLPALSE